MRPALCSSYGGNEADGVLLETPAWALKASKTAVISLLLWMSGRHCSLIHVMDVFNVRKQAKQLCVGFFLLLLSLPSASDLRFGTGLMWRSGLNAPRRVYEFHALRGKGSL